MKEPLHHDELFGSIWHELFAKEGSVVANIQNSDKLKALLVAAQREGASPLRLPTSHQPLTAVLQSLRFAKQRFDSTVDPVTKASLMLMPVATVLAFTASDTRVNPKLRQRAKESLEFLTSKHCFGLGVSADWGIVWEAYLRLFDAGDHDIACSSEEIAGLTKSIEKLFVDRAVFQDQVGQEPLGQALQPDIVGKLLPPTIIQSMSAQGMDGQFINTLVSKNLEQKCTFNAGGDAVVMWGALQHSERVEIASRIENVAKVSIERLEADFPKTEMRFFLRAFDMPLIQAAFNPQGSESQQQALTRCCEAALRSMRCPADGEATALLDYRALAHVFAGLAAPNQPWEKKTNREIWGHCLDPAFLGKHLPGRSCTQMQALVRFYGSILDGSCGIERGLAKARATITTFSADCDVVEDVLVLQDTKLQAGEVAQEVHGIWEAGAFGVEAATLWRAVLGARLGIYSERATPNKNLVKPGSYKSVKVGVLKAIGAATSRPNHQPFCGAQPHTSLYKLLASRNPKSSSAGTAKCPFWHKGFPHLFINVGLF